MSYRVQCALWFVHSNEKSNTAVAFEEIKYINNHYDYYPDINVEYKPENWGKYEGDIVCIDYGLDNKQSIKERKMIYASKSKHT